MKNSISLLILLSIISILNINAQKIKVNCTVELKLQHLL